MDATLQRMTDFVASIGIKTVFRNIEKETVLPGLCIEQGELHIDLDKLSYPGDVLHEAGHIAVVAEAERDTLHDDNIPNRKDRAAEEMMSIAWSYAAAMHLGIAPEVVFHEYGYKGDSYGIISQIATGRVPGLPMLQYTGMSLEPGPAHAAGKQPYPAMQRWLRA
jgi:hypothetical protein